MMDESKKNILYLMFTNIPGFGPVGQHEVMNVLGDPDLWFSDYFEVKKALLMAGCPRRYINAFIKGRFSDGLREEAEEIALSCENKGINIVTAAHPDYPK